MSENPRLISIIKTIVMAIGVIPIIAAGPFIFALMYVIAARESSQGRPGLIRGVLLLLGSLMIATAVLCAIAIIISL